MKIVTAFLKFVYLYLGYSLKNAAIFYMQCKLNIESMLLLNSYNSAFVSLLSVNFVFVSVIRNLLSRVVLISEVQIKNVLISEFKITNVFKIKIYIRLCF
jgi:hypothetical protein